MGSALFPLGFIGFRRFRVLGLSSYKTYLSLQFDGDELGASSKQGELAPGTPKVQVLNHQRAHQALNLKAVNPKAKTLDPKP